MSLLVIGHVHVCVVPTTHYGGYTIRVVLYTGRTLFVHRTHDTHHIKTHIRMSIDIHSIAGVHMPCMPYSLCVVYISLNVYVSIIPLICYKQSMYMATCQLNGSRAYHETGAEAGRGSPAPLGGKGWGEVGALANKNIL